MLRFRALGLIDGGLNIVSSLRGLKIFFCARPSRCASGNLPLLGALSNGTSARTTTVPAAYVEVGDSCECLVNVPFCGRSSASLFTGGHVSHHPSYTNRYEHTRRVILFLLYPFLCEFIGLPTRRRRRHFGVCFVF
jgi:hypothetical protein